MGSNKKVKAFCSKETTGKVKQTNKQKYRKQTKKA